MFCFKVIDNLQKAIEYSKNIAFLAKSVQIEYNSYFSHIIFFGKRQNSLKSIWSLIFKGPFGELHGRNLIESY